MNIYIYIKPHGKQLEYMYRELGMALWATTSISFHCFCNFSHSHAGVMERPQISNNRQNIKFIIII